MHSPFLAAEDCIPNHSPHLKYTPQKLWQKNCQMNTTVQAHHPPPPPLLKLALQLVQECKVVQSQAPPQFHPRWQEATLVATVLGLRTPKNRTTTNLQNKREINNTKPPTNCKRRGSKLTAPSPFQVASTSTAKPCYQCQKVLRTQTRNRERTIGHANFTSISKRWLAPGSEEGESKIARRKRRRICSCSLPSSRFH